MLKFTIIFGVKKESKEEGTRNGGTRNKTNNRKRLHKLCEQYFMVVSWTG